MYCEFELPAVGDRRAQLLVGTSVAALPLVVVEDPGLKHLPEDVGPLGFGYDALMVQVDEEH